MQQERVEDRNRLYYYLEIAQTLKDNQIKRRQRKGRKRHTPEEGNLEEMTENER